MIFLPFTESLLITATSSGAAQTLYTCPDNLFAEVSVLLFSNSSASNVNCTLSMYHSHDASTHSLLSAHKIAGNDTEVIISGPPGGSLFLNPGDKFTVYADTGSAVNVTISVRQYRKGVKLNGL